MDLFAMKGVLNENASIQALGIEKVNFFGSLTESFEQANLIMNEAAHEVAISGVMTQEVLLEAAGCDGDTFEVLNENVFKSVWDKVVGFFKTIKGVVMGLIDRIKASFAKMSGDTKKWLKVMKKPVEDNMKNASKFKYEGFPYSEFIAAGKFDDKIATISDQCTKDLSSYKDYLANVTAFQANIDEKRWSNAAADWTGEAKLIDTKFDKVQADRIERFYGTIGFKTKEEISTKTKEAIYGKGPTRIEITGFSKGITAANMLEAIDKAPEFVDKLKENYEAINESIDSILTVLGDGNTAVNDLNVSYEGASDTEKAAISAKKSQMGPFFSMLTSVYKEKQSALQTMSAVTKEIHSAQVKDFMNILSKFARFKPGKND